MDDTRQYSQSAVIAMLNHQEQDVFKSLYCFLSGSEVKELDENKSGFRLFFRKPKPEEVYYTIKSSDVIAKLNYTQMTILSNLESKLELYSPT